MLIKSKDDLTPTLKALQALLANSALTKSQRENLKEELWNVQSGARGEQEAAYQIDFRLKDSKNYTVLHDLRLEYNGRVAQIDHLLIGRFFDIFLIESKNIGTAVQITPEGEFQVKTRYGWRGMASPIEQSKRHALVLDEMILAMDLAPKRLGFRIRPTYHHWVLVPPKCDITRQSKDVKILKQDMFSKALDDWHDGDSMADYLSVTKVVSQQTILEFGAGLAALHRPVLFDFAAKFGVQPTTPQQASACSAEPKKEATQPLCEGCQTPLDSKTVNFCRLNKSRFGGRLICRNCQSSTPAQECQECGAAIDAKTEAYCRFNSRKFNKRLLCRTCQGNAVTALPGK